MEKPKRKVNGKRNKQAGHQFERDVVLMFREIGFPHVITTRAGSRHRDSQGVDIINEDESENGRLPYNVQCKSVTGKVEYNKILASMPGGKEINVILHRFTKRALGTKKKPGQQYVTQGNYAIMNTADFLKLIQRLHNTIALLKTYVHESSIS